MQILCASFLKRAGSPDTEWQQSVSLQANNRNDWQQHSFNNVFISNKTYHPADTGVPVKGKHVFFCNPTVMKNNEFLKLIH